PGSYTGEDVVELHVPGGPLLVQFVLEDLIERGAQLGARLALPGEFTARACQNGRLDPARAEGLLLLLHAADQRGAAAAVQWLRGGLGAAAADLRERLQDALAAIEAGLDFGPEEGVAAAGQELRDGLDGAARRLAELAATVPAAAPGGEVLLVGAANAGKSSLCNALAGRAAALVDSRPGTTRDVLRIEIAPGVAVWDAPGDLDDPSEWDHAALELRDRLGGGAAAALVVLDGATARAPLCLRRLGLPLLAVVWTRCDLVAAVPELPAPVRALLSADTPVLVTSARTGRGVPTLRDLLVERASSGGIGAGAPLREGLRLAAAAVARAAAGTVTPELAAIDLQAALRALDDVEGRHSPEHLLDRIYARFCLGK
ncbi:MAG: hypothetical protein FJ265_14345, partial [Planctomycetes bacterium]|nr:hypothetical protein [Planctomycetota bacterium]